MHTATYYIDLLLSGITVGSLYALIAIGYTMVYGILRLINFAHGDIFMMSGFFMIYVSATLPMAVSIPVVLLMTVLLGVLIERAAYKPLRSAPRMSVMISAIGVSYLLQNLATYITGGLARPYPEISFLKKSFAIGSLNIKIITLLTPVLTILLVIALVIFIKHTKTGMAMRAVSKDFDTARLMGIKVNSVITVTFIIGSFLAGVGSIPGAVLGAYIIGVCESLIKANDSIAIFSNAFTFALLIVVLLFKPNGMFGEKLTEKV